MMVQSFNTVSAQIVQTQIHQGQVAKSKTDEKDGANRCSHEDFHKANGGAKPEEVSPRVTVNHFIREAMKKGP